MSIWTRSSLQSPSSKNQTKLHSFLHLFNHISLLMRPMRSFLSRLHGRHQIPSPTSKCRVLLGPSIGHLVWFLVSGGISWCPCTKCESTMERLVASWNAEYAVWSFASLAGHFENLCTKIYTPVCIIKLGVMDLAFWETINFLPLPCTKYIHHSHTSNAVWSWAPSTGHYDQELPSTQ